MASLDDQELLRQLTAVIARAWDEGCPIAGPDRRLEVAAIALRRWRSVGRRRVKGAALEDQVEDLARGLRDHLEVDPELAGPLMEDYRYLARQLAPTLAG